MPLNMWIYDDIRSFEDILKLFPDILKYENIFEVEVEVEGDRTKQPN